MKRSQRSTLITLIGILLLAVGAIVPALAQGPAVPPPPDGHNPDFDATAAKSEAAYAIRGLIEVARTTEESAYLEQVVALWNDLAAQYDAPTGTFANPSTYTIDDVASIVGAINALGLFGGDAVDDDVREAVFAGFYESVVDLSGLQIATPPIPLFKGAYEQGAPPIWLRYPT